MPPPRALRAGAPSLPPDSRAATLPVQSRRGLEQAPEGCDRLCVAAANNEAEQLRKTLAFILPVTILCIKFYVFFLTHECVYFVI